MFKRLAIFIFFIFLILSSGVVIASTLSARLKGRILLQVESKGEAWYVNPANEKRYYLGRPDDAFAIMRGLGIGISNTDLNKIASNTGSVGSIDLSFSRTNAGKIFLQVESHGEAWYVNPVDLKRYYLGRPLDAFNLMRKLGLGISNADLNTILIATIASSNSETVLAIRSDYQVMEKKIHDLINQERLNNNLKSLRWNDELAVVARNHSEDLAKENIFLIRPDIKCNLPIIHHENTDLNFGLYNGDRLKSRKINYWNASAENIALIPSITGEKYYQNSSTTGEIADCRKTFYDLDEELKQDLNSTEVAEEKVKIINDAISYRKQLVASQPTIEIIQVYRQTDSEASQQAVTGWMNSPGHRANILTAEYDEAGIGIASIKDYFIITQVFIARIYCGYQAGPCCEKPGYVYCYSPFNCRDSMCN